MNKQTMDTFWSVTKKVNLLSEGGLFFAGIYCGSLGNYAQGAFYLSFAAVLILIDRNWWR